MPEQDLIGGVGDRLVRRRAGTAHRVRLAALRQHGQQRHLAGDVRRDDGGNHRAVDHRLDELGLEVGALNELGDAELPELDRREMLERRAGAHEGSANTGDDRDAATRAAQGWHAWKLA